MYTKSKQLLPLAPHGNISHHSPFGFTRQSTGHQSLGQTGTCMLSRLLSWTNFLPGLSKIIIANRLLSREFHDSSTPDLYWWSVVVVNNTISDILPCKAKRQYLLTSQVSRYCLLALQSSIRIPYIFIKICAIEFYVVCVSA